MYKSRMNMTNAFSVLGEDCVKSQPQKRNRFVKTNNNKNRKRKRAYQPAFPALPGTSTKQPALQQTQLQYNSLIPNLNNWKLKAEKKQEDFNNFKRNSPSTYSDEENDSDSFNQVWCVEKSHTTFDSDMYSLQDDTDSEYNYCTNSYDSY